MNPPDFTAADHSSAMPELEVAHILFMDIVGYSLLPMAGQTQLLRKLQEVVSATAEYRKAQAANQLISLPTGDGMALVFSGDPVAPVDCAVAVSRALREIPEIKLRMGLHSGPVYRTADINANRNVAGGGINMAQRVMDCGDAGHILLSRNFADILHQLGGWASHLHDLGEQVVKHGVRVHVYNLYTEDAGNPALPQKIAAAIPGTAKSHSAEKGLDAGAGKRSKSAIIVVGIAVAVLIAAGVWYAMSRPPAGRSSPAASLPSHSFSYSVLVQRFQDGKPDRKPFVLPGEMIFEQGYHIRLNISSPETGHLYVLNEGPEGIGGGASYNILFPGRDESARLAARQSVQIPAGAEDWFVFDAQEGVEKLWLVWAAAEVPVLEQAKAFGDAQHRGEIDDRALALRIQELLNQQQGSPPSASRDEVNQKTIVTGSGGTIAKLVRLEHH